MNFYFKTDTNFKAIAILDELNCPFDIYRDAMYLKGIDISDKYGRTNDVTLNALLLKKYLEKQHLSGILILLTDKTINSLSFLNELCTDNFIFILSKNIKLESSHKKIYVQHVPPNCDEKLFINRAGTHLKKILENQFTDLNAAQEFPKEKITIQNLEDIFNSQINRFEAVFEREGFKFSFLCNIKKWTKRLVIVNQSAIDITKQKPPVYQRWKWADDFNATTIVLNDPMLFLADNLNGGWWIGSKKVDLIQTLIKEIKQISIKYNIKNENIIFYGGSAGGYTSLQMAACCPNSTAIVDIPQTDLLKYSHRNQIIRAFEAGFGKDSFEKLSKDFCERLSVIERIKRNQSSFNLIYLQNDNDVHHVRSHFIPFIEYLKSIDYINYKCFIYSLLHPIRGGHFPLGRFETTLIVNTVIELSKMNILPSKFENIGLSRINI